jgi:hypothetical protein
MASLLPFGEQEAFTFLDLVPGMPAGRNLVPAKNMITDTDKAALSRRGC